MYYLIYHSVMLVEDDPVYLCLVQKQRCGLGEGHQGSLNIALRIEGKQGQIADSRASCVLMRPTMGFSRMYIY